LWYDVTQNIFSYFIFIQRLDELISNVEFVKLKEWKNEPVFVKKKKFIKETFVKF